MNSPNSGDWCSVELREPIARASRAECDKRGHCRSRSLRAAPVILRVRAFRKKQLREEASST
jgi:hypothetical protein